MPTVRAQRGRIDRSVVPLSLCCRYDYAKRHRAKLSGDMYHWGAHSVTAPFGNESAREKVGKKGFEGVDWRLSPELCAQLMDQHVPMW